MAEDPYSRYGGAVVTTEDPYAAYGGATHQGFTGNPKSPAEVAAWLKNSYSDVSASGTGEGPRVNATHEQPTMLRAGEDQPSIATQVGQGVGKNLARSAYEVGKQSLGPLNPDMYAAGPDKLDRVSQTVQRVTAPQGPAEETGDLLGTGAQLAYAAPGLTRLAGSGLKALVRGNPRVDIARSLRPTPSQAGFSERVPQTIQAIKEANPGFKPAVNEGTLNVWPAAQKAADVYRQALEPWLERAEGTTFRPPVVEATIRAARDSMLPSEAPQAQALVERAAQDFGHDFTPREGLDRLETLNKRLSGFYDKSNAKQSAALADIPEAVLKAQRDALADSLYRHLDPEGAGAGPRLIQSHRGDLIDFHKAAERRNEAIVAEQPSTVLERIADPLRAGIRHIWPGSSSAANLAFSDSAQGRSLPLLKRAFRDVGDEPLNVLPRPATPYYPRWGEPAQVRGQLPAPNTPYGVSGVTVPDIPGRRPPVGPAGLLAPPEQLTPNRMPQQRVIHVAPPDIPVEDSFRSWTSGRPAPPSTKLLEPGPTPSVERQGPGMITNPPTRQGSAMPLQKPVEGGLRVTPARKIVDPKTGKIQYTSEPERAISLKDLKAAALANGQDPELAEEAAIQNGIRLQ